MTSKQWRSLASIFFVCLICLGITFTNSFAPNVSAATEPSRSQIIDRFENIKTKMAKLRFCYNESCFYRNVVSKVVPPTNTNPHYTAEISAAVERPSSSPDLADYHFIYIDDRWQLVKGEEFTDVADYVFIGDRYEIYSVHNSHTLRGNLDKAKEEGGIKSGYLPLYYEVLNRGIEKL
ncbi:MULTISPECIES: hypothetical protein [Pseudanabaena]|uniref:Uncharacterized protein n=2 Tax=Pseudanabaena TaxID=1152 RepID=A0A9X4RJM5_9CYAN|nr:MULTISPECIES: hypothetical protein [Pseudanabaena]ELS30941.1 putative lipoprotein [Pseudanabaena biceps PCC 7429]MDG3496786.1 hypothetical protein [Pseudanabaena catenata USMAC16]